VIGTNGIIVKKNNIDGKRARKKSKEIAEARKVSRPSNKPLKKNCSTVNKGSPSKAGKTTFLSDLITKAVALRIKGMNLLPRCEKILWSLLINVLLIKNYGLPLNSYQGF